MKKKKAKQIIAGALALLISCSTLLNTGLTAFAAENSVIQETANEETEEEVSVVSADKLPEISDVLEQLSENELVSAEDISIVEGEVFDITTDFTGLKFDDEKVVISLEKSESETGQTFDSDISGIYQAFYRVEPMSGHPSYQIMRRIIVNEKEPETQGQQNDNGTTKDDSSAEDGEADPDQQEIAEQLTEVPEVPEEIGRAHV